MARNETERAIRRVGIVSKPGREDIPELAGRLVSWLKERGIETESDLVTAEYLQQSSGFDREDLPPNLDLLIVLGGDGTLLSAARGLGRHRTPVLAVNLGGLGFMMTTGPDEALSQLERVVAGDYSTTCRSVLTTEIVRNGESLGPPQRAQRRRHQQGGSRASVAAGRVHRQGVGLQLSSGRHDHLDAYRLNSLLAFGGRSGDLSFRRGDLPDADLSPHADEQAAGSTRCIDHRSGGARR